MTTEFLDLKDPESFVASIDRNPKNLVRVILEKIFPKLTTTRSWSDSYKEVIDEPPINIE
jgi:hypothetical protein